MNKLLKAERITLAQLARQQNVSLATAWRWCLRGARGHVLQSFVVGGRRYTHQQFFEEWIEAINGTSTQGAATTVAARQREIERAERSAEDFGV